MSNTAEQFALIWSKKLAKAKIVLARLTRDIGSEGVKFFLDQFKKQADPENKPRTPRKDGDASRSLLVKSGRLRRSIRITRLTQKTMRIGASNVPYAQYHQDGPAEYRNVNFWGVMWF